MKEVGPAAAKQLQLEVGNGQEAKAKNDTHKSDVSTHKEAMAPTLKRQLHKCDVYKTESS